MVSDYAFYFLGAVFVNNVVLSRFLGLCPLMGVSNSLETALGMGFATSFVLTLSSVCGYFVENYFLAPFGLSYLKTISFILVIAVIVQLTEMYVQKASPLLSSILGIYLPLITTNCAVLGVALLNVQEGNGLFMSAIYGFGSAVGFVLVMILFASLRERVEVADVPKAFKGIPIALVTAGFMSVAFMGFSGLG